MDKYKNTISEIQSIVPKIDYSGFEDFSGILKHISTKVQPNTIEIADTVRLQLEAISREYKANVKIKPLFDFSINKSFKNQFVPFQEIEGSVYDAFLKVDTENLAKIVKILKPFARYDCYTMAKALQDSFLKSKESVTENEPQIVLESIVKEVQEECNKEDVSDDGELVSKGNEKKKKKVTSDDVWQIIGKIALIISIIAGLKEIFGGGTSKINNTVYETNYYYINELNIDANYWNMFQYRIVNRGNVMPRIKPDCTSRVVDHLSEGRVVQVLNKHEKWVQIYWKDENNNDCYGWIQNYKLNEFKNNQFKKK